MTAVKRQSKYDRRRREAILAAAAVFAENGYHGASTQAIAERLGMQQGSLYYYFDSKEQALEEVCLAGVEGAWEQLKEIIARPESVVARLRAVVHRHLYGLAINCEGLIVFNEQRHHLPAERRQRVRTHTRRYQNMLQQLIAEGIKNGELRANLEPELAMRALLGLCNSVANWYKHEPNIDLNHVAERYADYFLSGTQTTVPEQTSAHPKPRLVSRRRTA